MIIFARIIHYILLFCLMYYSTDELRKIILLLESEDSINFTLGINMLLGEDITLELGFLVYLIAQKHKTQENIQEKVMHLLTSKLAPSQVAKIISSIDWFDIPNHTFKSHSEHTFDVTEEEAQRYWNGYILAELDEIWLLENSYFFGEKLEELTILMWTYHKFVGAGILLEKLIQKNPQKAVLYYYLAQIRQKQNLNAQAFALYEKFIKLEPVLLPDNHYELQEWFIEYRNYAPSTVEALTEMSRISLESHHWEQAKAFFKQAIELRPLHHQAPYQYLVGGLIHQEHNYAEALPLHILYLEVQKNVIFLNRKKEFFIQEYTWIADIYAQELRNFSKAMGFYRKVLHLSPQSLPILEKQLELVIKEGKDIWQERLLCEQILKKQKNHLFARQHLHTIKQKLGY